VGEVGILVISHMEEKGNAHTILISKLERKRPLGRSKLRWEDNIGMCSREIEGRATS
jgi:hypothetical protein